MGKELLNTFNKQLLFKDLCARLPYGVKVQSYSYEGEIETIETLYEIDSDGYMSTIECDTLKNITKPYLFPLSSMTEEQKEELKNEISKQTDILIERMKNDDCGIDCGKYHFHSNLELEWLLKNHFDYRGLIPKGLAIDTTGLNIY